MSEIRATKCDRCGDRTLSPEYGAGDYSAGWGTMRIQRGEPFCDSGRVDLCPRCWVEIYAHLERKPVTP